MDEKHRYLLASYQYLMASHEKLAARWLTEVWDGDSDMLPRWLIHRISESYTTKVLDDPSQLVRTICLRLLRDHKNEISLSGAAI